ncbi:RDD family protein [Nocardioides mesophilus]|uniref:RDD family protein n=1 Tax=Nocardioides mesophilus TaxID=433659 RepID=A0A7G9RB48_9ACTN|nr:RDD family protein [Nocardioides mesophilus]QNN52823.1 RDD family protein [Nocardioides mesophilus]
MSSPDAGAARSGPSPLPRAARGFQGRRAGLVTRLVAASIDALVTFLILAGAYAGWAALLFMIDPRGFRMPSGSLFASALLGLVVLVVYLTLSWWSSGRSYGCLVMGLRVVDGGGASPAFVRALLRAMLCGLFPIGLLWVGINRRNRSVQDIILGTSVIYDWQTGEPRVG